MKSIKPEKMKTIIEIILNIVYRNIGNDGAFTVLLLNKWIKYAMKEQGYRISDVNLTHEVGNRYQGTLNYIENGIKKLQNFRIIYDGINFQVVDLGTSILTQEEESIENRYIREAENGNVSAMMDLASSYYKGETLEQSYENAVKWFKRAAEHEDTLAQNMLGICYDNGEGVSQDFTEAAKWYRMAAEQGDADAQSTLGLRYYNGKGVNQDFTEAVKWFRLAAEQGDADAQFWLGTCYEDGEGVSQDFTEAARWFRLAAKQGDSDAQSRLEKVLSKAKKEEAVKSMRESVEQGKDDDALLKLGLVHYAGYGVEKNQQLAQKYFKRAAELGNRMAQLIIDGNEEALEMLKAWEDSDDKIE